MEASRCCSHDCIGIGTLAIHDCADHYAEKARMRGPAFAGACFARRLMAALQNEPEDVIIAAKVLHAAIEAAVLALDAQYPQAGQAAACAGHDGVGGPVALLDSLVS
jgi:hypothetical protein